MARRKKPKPKAFRQVQKEVNDLIKYQFQDLDFWPKMIKKRSRALKKIFNEEFGGEVDSKTRDKLKRIRDDLNDIATKSQNIHSTLGEVIQDNGSTDERKTLLSSWQDESWKVVEEKPMKLEFGECEHNGDLDHYLKDIRWAGGRVVKSRLGRGDSCVVEIMVKDRNDFIERFKKTEACSFSQLGLWG